jgi:Fic family protein
MNINLLPLSYDFDQIDILKKCTSAHRKLAELKGICKTIPNSDILINNLTLTEAKESSAIENIITTYNNLYQQELSQHSSAKITNQATKEVVRYREAIKYAYEIITSKKLLTNNDIININNILQNITDCGFRNQIGTVLKNDSTGEIIYTPPLPQKINKLMDNLEIYINDNNIQDIDPLIKMAIIHHQFESIHPFFDGNGRTGRIINISYLIMQNLIDSPILYLSRYFIQHKDKYYQLIQNVRDYGDWKAWVMFVLDAVEMIAGETITLITTIKNLQKCAKDQIQKHIPKIYSKDLLDHLFIHTYTTATQLKNILGISRQTATKYLNSLAKFNILHKVNQGKYTYFIHKQLYLILSHNLEIKHDHIVVKLTESISFIKMAIIDANKIHNFSQFDLNPAEEVYIFFPEEEEMKALNNFMSKHNSDINNIHIKSNHNPYDIIIPIYDFKQINYQQRHGTFNDIKYQFIATNLKIINFGFAPSNAIKKYKINY